MKAKSFGKKHLFLCTRIICIAFFAIGLAAIGRVYWRVTSPYSTFYSQLRPLQGKIMDIKKEDLEEAEITIYSRKAGTGSYLINDEEKLAALADYLNRIRFWTWVRTDWRPTHSAVDIRLRFKKPVPEPKWENSGDLRIYIYYHTPENGGPIPKDFCTLQMDNAKYAVDMKYLQEIVELWRERERTGSIPPAERWDCNAFTGASAFDLEQCAHVSRVWPGPELSR